MGSQTPDALEDAFTDIVTGMREWRLQHPTATLRDIEAAMDERYYRVRARLLDDPAREREAANWQPQAASDRPTCPDCGRPLIRRGHQPRLLNTHGGHELTLSRSYGYCPSCKKGLFPPR